MATRQFDLTQYSIEELLMLSGQIELRINELLNATAPDSQAHSECPESGNGCHHPTHHSSYTGSLSSGVTLSERVRGLIQANDPYKPFATVFLVAPPPVPPEHVPRSPSTTPPLFGGPPCDTFSGGTRADLSRDPSSDTPLSQTRQTTQ